MDDASAALIGGIGGGAAGGAIAMISVVIDRRLTARDDRLVATREAAAALEGAVRTLCTFAHLYGEQRAHKVRTFTAGDTIIDLKPLIPALAAARSAFDAVAPDELLQDGAELVDKAFAFVRFAESAKGISSEALSNRQEPLVERCGVFRAKVRAVTGPAALTRTRRRCLERSRPVEPASTSDLSQEVDPSDA